MAELLTGYHYQSFNRNARKTAIEVACNLYRENFPISNDITLVFTGVSGMAIGFPVADILNIPFAVVRKSMDSSHSNRLVEGYMNKKYVILDDFISSGKTIERVVDTYEQQCTDDGLSNLFHPLCQGVILYAQMSDMSNVTNQFNFPVYR